MKRHTNPDVEVFPTKEQMGVILWASSGMIERIPIPEWVAECRDAVMLKYGFEMIAVVQGQLGNSLTLITAKGSVGIVYPIRDADGEERQIYIYVREVEADDTAYNDLVARKIFQGNDEEQKFAKDFSGSIDASIAAYKKNCRSERVEL